MDAANALESIDTPLVESLGAGAALAGAAEGASVAGLAQAGSKLFALARSSASLAAGRGARFASKELLSKHFGDHGVQVGARSESHYLALARRAMSATGEGIETAVRANGDKLIYNLKTKELVIVTKSGKTIRTYFIAGLKYWRKQVRRAAESMEAVIKK